MFTERINKLKNKINEYVTSGGSVYAGRRELPYYKYMSILKRDMEDQFGVTLTMEYIYALCGIKFDREYNHYNEICEKLAEFADEFGCVDKIRSEGNRKEDGIYNELREMARKNGVALIDYVYFMTPYHLSAGRVQGDSIAKLKRDLLKAYPNRDLTGIRWENTSLYERLRAIHSLMPESLSRQEFIEFLGFTNERFSSKQKPIKVDEKEVIKELNLFYPNKTVSNITNKAKVLYYKILKLALNEDLTIQQWLKNKGFNYVTGISSSRLSSTQISFKAREDELLPLKKKYEKKFLKPNLDEIGKYYAKLNIMKQSLSEFEKNESNFDIEHGLTDGESSL